MILAIGTEKGSCHGTCRSRRSLATVPARGFHGAHRRRPSGGDTVGPRLLARRHTSSLVLLTLTGDADWQLLARLHDTHIALPLIALIDGTAEHGVQAVRAGARSVLPRSVAGDVLQRTVDATLDGQAVLPADVAERLAAGIAHDAPHISADRVGWLRQLASGVTVAQIADRAGYSERAMFRLLTALYSDIGAHNRIEAIMLARDRGWL